jgi:hypothetical protein
VDVPPGLRLTDVRGDAILGIWTDELDVPPIEQFLRPNARPTFGTALTRRRRSDQRDPRRIQFNAEALAGGGWKRVPRKR